MTNTQIKKGIQDAIKYFDTYRIQVELWLSDGTCHSEGEVICNTVCVYDNDYEIIYHQPYGRTLEEIDDIFDTEENLKELKAEQKKMHSYLNKHFKNVTMEEITP